MMSREKSAYLFAREIIEQVASDELIFFDEVWDEIVSGREKGESFFHPGAVESSTLTSSLVINLSLTLFVQASKDAGLTEEEIKNLLLIKLREWKELDEKEFWNHFIQFKDAVLPVARKAGLLQKEEKVTYFEIGIDDENNPYVIAEGNKYIIRKKRLFPHILILAAAKKYGKSGWVDKREVLRYNIGDHDLADLREFVCKCFRDKIDRKKVIEAGQKGMIRLFVNPKLIKISNSVLKYEHPDKRRIEITIDNILRAWHAQVNYWKEAGIPMQEQIIPKIFEKRNISDPQEFLRKVEKLIDHTEMVQYAVENLMGKEFHDQKWKADWKKFLHKADAIAGLVARIPNDK